MADLMQLLTELGQPPQPEAPKSKRQQIGMAIGDFLQSIGAGLSNRGKAGQSTGAGAAMQMPGLLAQQRAQQMQAQQLQAQQQKQQQFQNLMAVVQQKAGQSREDRLSQPPAPQPFNLSPGQTRYGPDGKPIVSAPAPPPAPQPGFNLGPGQTRFGPDGKPIANIPAAAPAPPAPTPGFSLSPGQTRFGPDGNPIANVPAAPSGSGTPPVKPQDAASPYTAEREFRTLQSVDELLPQLNGWTTGYGALLKNWPRTQALYVRGQLETLISNIKTNELQAMRADSKTGGALGNVSDRESEFLGNALGSLIQEQDAADVKTQLLKVRASVKRWQEAKAAAQTKVINGATYEKVEGGWRLRK